MKDHIDYMQAEANKNMAFHIANMDSLQKEANNTLTFLFVAISASFSGAIKLFIDGKYEKCAISLAIVCVYLCVVAACLVFGCLWAKGVDAPGNVPKNLRIRDGFTSDQIQEWELENLQKRIDFNRKRNEETGQRLNAVRLALFGAPILFIFALAVLCLD